MKKQPWTAVELETKEVKPLGPLTELEAQKLTYSFDGDWEPVRDSEVSDFIKRLK